MPPTVEQLADDGYFNPIFSVDLDGPDDFNPAQFNEQLQEVANPGESRGMSFGIAKFIVLSSNMIIFPHSIEHEWEYRRITESGRYKGALACAGAIGGNFLEPGDDTVNILNTNLGPGEVVVSDYSASLRHILTISESEAYKHTVLRDKLGDQFIIK